MIGWIRRLAFQDQDRGASRTLLFACALWALAIAGVAVHAFLHPDKHSVFPIYAVAARAWWAGRPMYFQSQPDEFLYGPLFAIFVSPLAFLRASLGGMLWKVINATAFVVAMAAWLKFARREPLRSREMGVALLLALGECLQSLYDGNANLLVLAAILLALCALARSNKIAAGIWLAAATLVKAFPAMLAGLLAVVSGLTVAFPFAAAIAAGLLLPIGVSPRHGLGQTRMWFQLLLARTGEREARYCSIDQLLRVIGHPLPIAWSNGLMIAGALGAGLLCALYARRADRRDALTFALAAFSAWVILFLPTMESATAAILAPPIAVAIVSARRERSHTWLGILAAAWWLSGPALTDIAGTRARIFTQEHGALPVGGLLFASYVIATCCKAISDTGKERSVKAKPGRKGIGYLGAAARSR